MVPLLTLLLAGLAAADVRVSGRIVDENGVAIAGARIDIRRAAGGLATTAVSDLSGAFAFELPVAGDYPIRAERRGFFVFEGRTAFHDGDNQLLITSPHVKDFFQAMEVAASPDAIDPQQPADQKQLSSAQILEVPFPASQDVRNAMPLLQGVVQDAVGRLHFNGGATNQTNFLLDGFTVSDPVTGRFDARVNIETVRSVDYDATRFAADKGRGSAGTVDLKTGMGDDRWRFGATNFIPGVSTENDIHLNKWTPRVTASGPLVKGRAWFHNGFDAFYDVDTISGLPAGENRSRALTTSNLSRIQVNLAPGNILTAGFLLNYIDENHNGLSFLNPIEATINRKQNFAFATIKDQIYLGRGAIVEFGFADTRASAREHPQGSETYEILPSSKRGNYFVDFTHRANRQQWLTRATLPQRQWLGSHQVLVGIDAQRSWFDRVVDRHGYLVRRSDFTLARSVIFAGDRYSRRANFEAAHFVQDRWTPLDGLLIEGGLRADWDQITRDALYSPRLAAAWLVPKGAPAWLREVKIAAGVGIFHDALNLGMVSRNQDQYAFSTFYDRAGAVRGAPVQTAFLVDDRSLRVPRYRSVSLSLERKLPLGLFGRAAYVRKVGQRGLSFFGDAGAGQLPVDGQFYELRNWRNDRYDALEFTVRRSFGRAFEWTAGYTRSSARSDAVVDYSLENPIFAAQGRGPVAWDHPHRFMTWGWAPLPLRLLPRPLASLLHDTSAAYWVEFRTGFPFSVVNEEGVLAGAPNDHRLPDYCNVNLHFERRFRFLHHLWAWRAGVNNLTNSGNPNVVNNNIDSPMFLVYGRGQRRSVNVRLRFLGRR